MKKTFNFVQPACTRWILEIEDGEITNISYQNANGFSGVVYYYWSLKCNSPLPVGVLRSCLINKKECFYEIYSMLNQNSKALSAAKEILKEKIAELETDLFKMKAVLNS